MVLSRKKLPDGSAFVNKILESLLALDFSHMSDLAVTIDAQPFARPDLQQALKDPKETVRVYAILALRNLAPFVPVKQYEELTFDPVRNGRATIR